MQRNLAVSSLFVITLFSFFFWSCTKIDTTTLGSDLIPAVDNVTTFADTLDINCTQGLFNDSTRIGISELHPLGSIFQDPLFGNTYANLYLELKPGFFPYHFGNLGDTINSRLVDETGFDSAVLCLSYKSFYGDTQTAQHLSVYLISDNNNNFVRDSAFPINIKLNGGLNNDGLGRLVGEATILPTSLRNYTVFYPSPATRKDSVVNQIRINLNKNNFLQDFIAAWDSTPGRNNLYTSDSLFKSKIKGFAVVADSGQGKGLFYVSLTDATTRLEVHYKYRNANKFDTSFSSFYFVPAAATSLTASAQATRLIRNYTDAEYEPSVPATDAVYIQTTPGTYANLSIPGLATLPNSIIHRAEIFVEQIPSPVPGDNIYAPPLYLYLDLIDTTSGNPSKPVYFDLNPTTSYNPDYSNSFLPAGGVDFIYFGGYRRIKDDGSGPLYYYNFNVSRYVQHIVTDHLNNYNMKLYAPYNLHYYGFSVPFKNNLANGRIKVGNGKKETNVNYRMKMRIVYSKI